MTGSIERGWVKYLDSLDDSKRYEVIAKYYEFCDGASFSKAGDVMEYLLFIYAGKVAPMPDMSIWV